MLREAGDTPRIGVLPTPAVGAEPDPGRVAGTFEERGVVGRIVGSEHHRRPVEPVGKEADPVAGRDGDGAEALATALVHQPGLQGPEQRAGMVVPVRAFEEAEVPHRRTAGRRETRDAAHGDLAIQQDPAPAPNAVERWVPPGIEGVALFAGQ